MISLIHDLTEVHPHMAKTQEKAAGIRLSEAGKRAALPPSDTHLNAVGACSAFTAQLKKGSRRHTEDSESLRQDEQGQAPALLLLLASHSAFLTSPPGLPREVSGPPVTSVFSWGKAGPRLPNVVGGAGQSEGRNLGPGLLQAKHKAISAVGGQSEHLQGPETAPSLQS